MTDHLAKVEVDVFARLVLEAEASGTRTIPVDLYMAQQILKDLRAKDGSIPEEWRLLLRGAREDVEILTRVRDTLLKKLADQKAEFSAKEQHPDCTECGGWGYDASIPPDETDILGAMARARRGPRCKACRGTGKAVR